MATLNLRIYQKVDQNTHFSIILENKKHKTSLLFQAGTVAELSQPETDSIRGDHYTRLADSYGCLGVLQMCPRENTELYLVVVTRCAKVCVLLGCGVYKIQEVDVFSLQAVRPSTYKSQDDESWVKELKKLLGNESFYFSSGGRDEQAPPVDLTLCSQRRVKTNVSDNRFFWNRMLYLHPKRFNIDCSNWLVKVVCGSIEFSTIYMNNHSPKLYIISRLSCERAGTRFMMRGVDDEGHVANFVETEQMIHVETLDNLVVSYVQTRGTVPLFWEQPGLNVGSHKVKMSREPGISSSAFSAHMRFLRRNYGGLVVINLLGTGVTGKSQGEAALSHLFQLQHHSCPWSRDCPHVVFDFHVECRGGNTENLSKKLLPQIQAEVEQYGQYWERGGVARGVQHGTIRSNCLDCLDRTNRIQTFLGVERVGHAVEVMGAAAEGGVARSRFQTKLEEMWRDNGNKISQIYAGTGALQGSKLIDGARSVGRTIQNNLLDSNKQEAIDLLLHGNLLNNYLAAQSRSLLPPHLLYAPIPVLKATCGRSPEFCQSVPFKVSMGTYNVNGGKHFRSLAYKHLSLDDWLLDARKNHIADSLVHTSAEADPDDDRPPDVFAIGFEEIVDLNASNIVTNTQWSENANSWGHELQKVISRDEQFVMVTWAQLVGVALFVFVNERHADHVKHVSVRTVKTGLQGNTGNKGGVGIRLVVRNTSLAFVCSHFAAGQKEVNERNQDYDSIARKMVFSMGVPLWAHDYVFWCGDFNYRLNLPREEVMDLVQRREWGLLLEHDQLRLSQKENKCFKGFQEGDIAFAPTYKYDLFSDDYDTSEKARVPAWTDRVLYWRRRYEWDKAPDWTPGRIVHYGCAALKQSDHRPVLASIGVCGRVVRPGDMERVYREVVASLGPSDCTVVVQSVSDAGAAPELSDEVLEAVQDAMDAVGSLVTVRFVDNKVLFTFDCSTQALQAVKRSPLKVCGLDLSVSLKTERWREQLEEEVSLCTDSTTPLTDDVPDQPPPMPPADVRNRSLLRPDNVRDVLGQLYAAEGLTPSPLPSPCPSPTMEDERPLAPVRPAPPRSTMPNRPPPPRPTPPSSGPSSPAMQRVKPKVFVITKAPARPSYVSPLDTSAPPSISPGPSPPSPADNVDLSSSSLSPSPDSPPTAETPIFNEGQPSSKGPVDVAGLNEEAPIPPLPDQLPPGVSFTEEFPPALPLESEAPATSPSIEAPHSVLSAFSTKHAIGLDSKAPPSVPPPVLPPSAVAPPPLPARTPSQDTISSGASTPCREVDPPKLSQPSTWPPPAVPAPFISPPAIPSATVTPPTGPAPSIPPSAMPTPTVPAPSTTAPSLPQSSATPLTAPPSLPPRAKGGPPSLPSRTSGPPPPLAARTLPPLPARTTPPTLPPRN